MQKRKQTTLRTLAKNKPISKECKSTVKRSTRHGTNNKHQYDEVGLTNGKGEEVRFTVMGEFDCFRWKMLKSLPSISMSYDNDE